MRCCEGCVLSNSFCIACTATANREVEALLVELDRQKDENRQQSEHIFALEAKLRDIEGRHTTVSSDY